MRILLCLVACVTLTACFVQTSSFFRYYIDSDRLGFRAETLSTKVNKDYDPSAERMRLSFVDNFVSANGLCPEGYEIKTREVIVYPIEKSGDDSRRAIIYHGRCNP